MGRIITSDRSVGGSGTLVITEVGATVAHAQKGFSKPLLFGANNIEQLKKYFGAPSADFPEIAEAYDFNTFGNLWISAPSKDGRYGAIAIPKVGDVIVYPLGLTETDIEVENFKVIMYDYKSTEAIVDLVGTYTTPTVDVGAESAFIYLKDGTKLVFTVETNAGVETYTLADPTQFSVFTSMVYTVATGSLVVTLTDAEGFDEIGEIGVRLDKSAEFTADGTVIVTTSTPTNIPVSISTVENNGLITLTAYETVAGVTSSKAAYNFSLDVNSTDDYKRPNYITDIISDVDPFIQVYTDGDVSEYTMQSLSLQELEGSTRGAALPESAEAGGSYAQGWSFFTNRARYSADIFFDSSDKTATVTSIDTILSGAQKNKIGIFAAEKLSATDLLAEPSVAKKGITNPDLACFDSWHYMSNTYGSGVILRNLTGRIAVKYAQMQNVFDGLSPSFVDENGHGGQLGGGVIEALYSDREAVLDQMDVAHINYVGVDFTYGLMIQGDRTCASDNGDYSFISRRRVRNLIAYQMVNYILPPQINKPNDYGHRRKIYSQASSLISPIANPALGILDEYLIVCDTSNNTEDVRALNEFVCDVVIKLTPNSQRIRLNIINVDQKTEITDYIGG